MSDGSSEEGQGQTKELLSFDKTVMDARETEPCGLEADTVREEERDTNQVEHGGQGAFANTARLKPAQHDDEDESERLRRRILERMAAEEEEQGPDPLIGQEIGGRFTVQSKIGEGGMGAVYKARQKGMDRDVAIKVLLRSMTENSTVKRRFSLEALAVSKLKHPNTIQIFDFGDTPAGELYIAMEFLDGDSLHDRLRARGALPVKTALKVAVQITKSLREAHGKGIVHRDLKPDNIFLTRVGEETDYVKVLDFGVAKLREGDEKQATLTKAGAVFGTPRYMSPEQGTSAGTVDHRSDLYAIGVILFEMCTGRAPFEAETALGILVQHMQEEVPAFVQVRPDLVIPESVEGVVRRLLDKDPDGRPQTAEAVIRELEKIDAELEDVYRRVVTSEYAEAVGIEVRRALPTRADTKLNTGAAQDFLTTGIDDDVTLYSEGRASKRRGKLKLIAAAAVAIVLGGAGAVYAMLDRLPTSYLDEQGRVAVVTGGALPEAKPFPDMDVVSITILSTPAGADVLIGTQKVGTTPYRGARVKDGGASVDFVVRKSGYQEQRFSGSLARDIAQNVDLAANQVTVLPPDPPVTPPTEPVVKTAKKPTKKKKPTVSKPASAKVEPKPAVVKTKKKKKGDPFGAKAGDLKE